MMGKVVVVVAGVWVVDGKVMRNGLRLISNKGDFVFGMLAWHFLLFVRRI